ncbi:MAG: hypothetical protein DRG31_01060 [Deltaproteobacteria bacterium]|nr:MAG: hypothetical protein DRG31_01060 [Deltaproteobacteria bacterium]
MAFSIEKARADENRINCHARIKASINFDREVNALDVHFAAGMGCLDCHSARDVHGDGTMLSATEGGGTCCTG